MPMNAISDVLLRAKHWHLFLAIVVFISSAVTAMLGSFALTPSGKFPSSVPFLAVMELFRDVSRALALVVGYLSEC